MYRSRICCTEATALSLSFLPPVRVQGIASAATALAPVGMEESDL